jgi:hypothetical protein
MRELEQRQTGPSSESNTTAVMVSNPATSVTNMPVSTTPVEAGTANPSGQAAALAALKQKMVELNNAKAAPTSDTNISMANTTNLMVAPANAAAAAPLTETPSAEAPAAASPAMVPTEGVPASVAPAIVTPAPKISTAPAAPAAVAVVPAVVPRPVVAPGGSSQTAAPARPGLPASAPGQSRPINELVTTSGAIYRNVEVERVLPDGIFISYTPTSGSWAMTKIDFQDLPHAIRQQYQKR